MQVGPGFVGDRETLHLGRPRMESAETTNDMHEHLEYNLKRLYSVDNEKIISCTAFLSTITLKIIS
jgi:hypothetical protein